MEILIANHKLSKLTNFVNYVRGISFRIWTRKIERGKRSAIIDKRFPLLLVAWLRSKVQVMQFRCTEKSVYQQHVQTLEFHKLSSEDRERPQLIYNQYL